MYKKRKSYKRYKSKKKTFKGGNRAKGKFKRANAKRTGYYSGTERIKLVGFNTETATQDVKRFDAADLPRFMKLAPQFRHFKFTRCCMTFQPRTLKNAWYNASAVSGEGRQIITWINKDGAIPYSGTPEGREICMLKGNAKMHDMSTISKRTFIPYAIKKTSLVVDDANATQDLAQLVNPWLVCDDPSSFEVDRTSIGFYAPPLVQNGTSTALSFGYDVYIDISYKFKGVNYTA